MGLTGASVEIAFVLRAFETGGGTENHAVAAARALVEAGHRLTVFAVRADLALIEALRVAWRPLHARREWDLDEAARRAVRLSDFDIVQGFGRTTTHHVYRAGGGVHAVWLERGFTGLLGRLRRRRPGGPARELAVDRAAQAGAEAVVYNSEMAREQAIAAYGVERSRSRVIRNGVDLDRFRPDDERRRVLRERIGVSGRLVVFLGSGYRRKGLAVAGAAFAEVATTDDRLVVAGADRHAERHLRPLRQRLGGRLCVLGRTQEAEVLLSAADATLLPTLYDSAANTTLEALASGTPPVTSIWDGNHELVPDARLVVRDPRDVAEVAAALTVALGEAEGLEARCRAAAEPWTARRNAEAFAALYAELVVARGR